MSAHTSISSRRQVATWARSFLGTPRQAVQTPARPEPAAGEQPCATRNGAAGERR
ncbi:hypothetical protein [Solidesulfovibrio sp.]|uniref:hypothetical protein n=1 Tax=Solidesulfovibrio sp. TaxID=2910990 RepID=UPI002B212727|nr:hypothetical protein [Solidesulfovibrio sp.]MEA5088356.1 hypothetical protein [Solidesulfovibrio sp.]